jgi:glutamate synthase (NADPH/NADH) large chain
VYDEDSSFASKCNMAMVAIEPVLTASEQEATIGKAAWHSLTRDGERQPDEAILKGLIERHFKHTGSTIARTLLDDWVNARTKFVKVFPTEYKRALGEMFAAASKAKEKVTA